MKIVNKHGFWECDFKNHTLFAFSLKELLRDLKTIYNVELDLLTFNCN